MSKKKNKVEVPVPVKRIIPLEQPIKKEEVKVLNHLEVIDREKVDVLQKQGYIVIEVKGEIKGERPKTWILKKENK